MADLYSRTAIQNCPNCLDKNNSQLLQDNLRLKVIDVLCIWPKCFRVEWASLEHSLKKITYSKFKSYLDYLTKNDRKLFALWPDP